MNCPANDRLLINSRPDFPPEPLARRRPTFQFPKTLLQPAFRWLARQKDQGRLHGIPLRKQIVICGFPRSGTTLLQLLIESCIKDIGSFGKERRALEIAACGPRTHATILTKRPKDVFLIPEIADWHQLNGSRVCFLLMHRDPRSVLTSKHFSAPSQYYLSCHDWLHFYQHWNWSRSRADVLPVSYEMLVSSPQTIQARICQFAALDTASSFDDYLAHVPRDFDLRALNGLRPTETSRINAWNSAEHSARLTQIHNELPQLAAILADMGYGPDQVAA